MSCIKCTANASVERQKRKKHSSKNTELRSTDVTIFSQPDTYVIYITILLYNVIYNTRRRGGFVKVSFAARMLACCSKISPGEVLYRLVYNVYMSGRTEQAGIDTRAQVLKGGRFHSQMTGFQN